MLISHRGFFTTLEGQYWRVFCIRHFCSWGWRWAWTGGTQQTFLLLPFKAFEFEFDNLNITNIICSLKESTWWHSELLILSAIICLFDVMKSNNFMLLMIKCRSRCFHSFFNIFWCFFASFFAELLDWVHWSGFFLVLCKGHCSLFVFSIFVYPKDGCLAD